jgi:ethanolamine transporter EutH
MQKLTFWDRLQLETPKFFKKLQYWVLAAAAIAGTLLGLTEVPGLENFVLPSGVIKACQWIIAISIGAGGTAKLVTKKATE